MSRSYGHGESVAAVLATWLPCAWAEVLEDVGEQVTPA